jgi:hypothetical protein
MQYGANVLRYERMGTVCEIVGDRLLLVPRGKTA